jgi:hypothetical protein
VQKYNSSRTSKWPSIFKASPNLHFKPPFLEALHPPLQTWAPPYFIFFFNCYFLRIASASPLACLPRRRAACRPLPLCSSARTLPPLPLVSAPPPPSLPLRSSLFLPSACCPVPCLAHADPLAASSALTPEARHRGGAGCQDHRADSRFKEIQSLPRCHPLELPAVGLAVPPPPEAHLAAHGGLCVPNLAPAPAGHGGPPCSIFAPTPGRPLATQSCSTRGRHDGTG